MSTERDYNEEHIDSTARRYAYGFDFEVMHPFMIRAFTPFLNKGNVLELGSFKGDFTLRLLDVFSDVTCVEASSEAVNLAKSRVGNRATIVQSLFEQAELGRRFDNIVLTHVLEHLDDPVGDDRKH